MAGRPVREVRVDGPVPLWLHPDWAGRFPWLAQGTTGRGEQDSPFDLGLFGRAPVGETLGRWRRLRDALGFPRTVHARQVHGEALLTHEAGPPGLTVSDGFDAHATLQEGVLLTVSVADCVPISLVDPERRAIALLHGGWRGVAANVLDRGMEALGRLAGSGPADLHVHLGPAICGECYEVGPEVHAALGLPEPSANTPIDLRAELARRASLAGVRKDGLTISEHCTRCGDPDFFSHRGGQAERQMAVLGLRPAGAG